MSRDKSLNGFSGMLLKVHREARLKVIELFSLDVFFSLLCGFNVQRVECSHIL